MFRKKGKFWILFLVGCAVFPPAVSGWGLFTATVHIAQSEAPDTDNEEKKADESPEYTLGDELRVMSKVIEESLNQSALGQWYPIGMGASPFEERVRHEYLPEVGALFFIDVNFPVVEPEPVETEVFGATRAVEEKDLWKRFESEGADSAPGLEAAAPSRWKNIEGRAEKAAERYREADDRLNRSMKDLDESLLILQSELGEVEASLPGESDPTPVRRSSRSRKSGGYGGMGGFGGGGGGFGGGGLGRSAGAPFVAAKVDTLRKTLIEAVARYAHRMTHVPRSERIFLLVEAPKGFAWVGATVYGLSRSGGGATLFGQRGITTEESKGKRSVTLFSFGDERGEKDRYLLSFHKSQVSQETTFEALEREVKETKYNLEETGE